MQAIDIKLLRDFGRLWLQGLAIAMVLACGVAILLTAFGMHTALNNTRDAYYERNRFAAEARVQGMALLDIPGRTETAIGQFLSWPESDAPLLNVPILRAGVYPQKSGEVLVNAAFAEANEFEIGDGFAANISGQRRDLTITGMTLSPEFIYTIGPGALMPDNEGFGIIWMTAAEIGRASGRE